MSERPGQERVRMRIRVTGKVQGVSFRASARRRAAQLGLSGSAMNLDDGSVLLEMEGDPAAIDALVAWCHEGPPLARVDTVTVQVD